MTFLFYDHPSVLLQETGAFTSGALKSGGRCIWLTDDLDSSFILDELRHSHNQDASEKMFAEQLCFYSLVEILRTGNLTTISQIVSTFPEFASLASAQKYTSISFVIDVGSLARTLAPMQVTPDELPSLPTVTDLISSSLPLSLVKSDCPMHFLWLIDLTLLSSSHVALALALARNGIYSSSQSPWLTQSDTLQQFGSNSNFVNPFSLTCLPEVGQMLPSSAVTHVLVQLCHKVSQLQTANTNLRNEIDALKQNSTQITSQNSSFFLSQETVTIPEESTDSENSDNQTQPNGLSTDPEPISGSVPCPTTLVATAPPSDVFVPLSEFTTIDTPPIAIRNDSDDWGSLGMAPTPIPQPAMRTSRTQAFGMPLNINIDFGAGHAGRQPLRRNDPLDGSGLTQLPSQEKQEAWQYFGAAKPAFDCVAEHHP